MFNLISLRIQFKLLNVNAWDEFLKEIEIHLSYS